MGLEPISPGSRPGASTRSTSATLRQSESNRPCQAHETRRETAPIPLQRGRQRSRTPSRYAAPVFKTGCRPCDGTFHSSLLLTGLLAGMLPAGASPDPSTPGRTRTCNKPGLNRPRLPIAPRRHRSQGRESNPHLRVMDPSGAFHPPANNSQDPLMPLLTQLCAALEAPARMHRFQTALLCHVAHGAHEIPSRSIVGGDLPLRPPPQVEGACPVPVPCIAQATAMPNRDRKRNCFNGITLGGSTRRRTTRAAPPVVNIE